MELGQAGYRHDDKGFEVKERLLPADTTSLFFSDVADVLQRQRELHGKNSC